MKKEIKIEKGEKMDWKISPEPTYFQIGKIRIVLETGNIEFLEGYNPNETAKLFWGFIAQYKPKFLEEEKIKINKNWEKEFRLKFANWLMVDEAVDFIRQLLEVEKQKWVEEILEKLPMRMDYLKWQLRTDLTHDERTTIEEATQKAKGWNCCLQEIKQIIKGIN